MDATAASLVTLWEWFLGEARADLPGVAANAQPSISVFLSSRRPRPEWRARAAAEPIVHYVFEVLRKEFPTARWVLDPFSKPNQTSYQEPGVLLPGPRCVLVREFVLRGARGAVQGPRRAGKSDWLLTEMELFGWQRPVDEVRGASILAPLLDLPRVGPDDPVRRVPVAVAPEAMDDGSWSMSDVGAMLAIRPDLDAELDAWPPLDEELVAERLAAGGWHTPEGGPITAALVRTDGAVLVWGDDQVQLEVTTAGGRARFLKLDIMRITDAEWAAVLAGLEELAERLGGGLGVPGEQE